MEYDDPPGISPEHYSLKQKDEKAVSEESTIQEESLEERSKRAEHERTERLKDAFSYGAVALLYTAFVMIGVTVLLIVWHYLTPFSWHWIEKTTLHTITNTVFSGSLFAFFGLYIRDKIRP